jgi:hypothetical protein
LLGDVRLHDLVIVIEVKVVLVELIAQVVKLIKTILQAEIAIFVQTNAIKQRFFIESTLNGRIALTLKTQI